MDILDRLTNREALRDALKTAPPSGPLSIEIDAPALADRLKGKVFGQDAVCEDVAREIKRRAARTGRSVPLGIFFFVGPPATGKTHFAKVLAASLPSEFTLLFVEMAQHSEPHTAAGLFGQAPGYVGSDRYGTLTGALRNNSRTVVVLDEFEKAHREVQEKFLSAWNDGFLTESSTGEKIATVNAIFIVTSNAAEREVGELAKSYAGDREALSQACKRALASHFSGPVLSRVDRVFPFLPLGEEDLARLIAGQIERNAAEFELAIAPGGLDFRILVDTIRDARRTDADAREISRIVSRAIDDELMAFKERHRGKTAIRLGLTEAGAIAVMPA
ncbi:AAA family ATPase [Jiella sonneratiae]|uniref:ATP-dependent Clp protease ATP-binding subunit n=1 Tax=Jiella sonneratiae TaxID=2816856 RepID=A0ABS3J9D1_9HYPH|nr:AAA family ATPase [Jiella sonneratiae]MBO0906279.1 ATP-dependent Clp protease ATP-binding subunit [Jiella sonneratiae]